jgi:membrane-associated phospholipid phosphatase
LANALLNKKINLFARIISTLFIPPINLFAVILYSTFLLENTLQHQIQNIVIAFIFVVLAPISFFFIMLKKKKIINQDAANREERTIPYLVGILFLLFGAVILYYSGINHLLMAFWIIQIFNSFLLITVNYFWKISAHLIGFSSPAAFLYFLTGYQVLLPILLMAAVIGWSRYYLKCHSIFQILAGFIFGFGFTYLQLIIYVGIR